MQPADIAVIRQIVMLTLLGLTGFVAGKTKYLPENSGVILSRVVIKLTAPVLIVTTMAEYKFSRETIVNGLWIFVFGVIFILFAGGLSWGTSRAMKLKEATANVYKMLSMFGNVIYMAYPILGALFGDEGIIYAVFFNIANDLILWTLGVYLVSRHKTNNWKDNLKHLINGNTVSFGTGILFIVINLQGIVQSNEQVKQVYDLLFNTFNPLGKTTIYLSMLFIGLILSEIRIESFTDLIKRYPLAVLSLQKLIVVPVIAMILLNAVGGFLSPMVKSIIVLQLAMPCGTIVSAMASQHDSDYQFTSEGAFVSTILSIITLPIIVHLTQIFG